MITSYHVHSNYSDGESTVLEIVSAAAEQGLDEIGISDHLVYPKPGRHVSWSMSVDRLGSYFEELHNVQRVVGDRIKVRLGLECDYEPETVVLLADLLQRYPLDYTIGSVHFLGNFPIDESPEHWDNLKEEDRNNIVRGYWQRIRELAESRLFNIVGHMDLYKKFGWRPSIDLEAEISEALDAISAAGMVVEVNTAGLTKPAREIYPSKKILEMSQARDIPLIITADAHKASGLTDGYQIAKDLLDSLGYSRNVIFSSRTPKMLSGI